jgi:hypothetical protein
MLNQAAVHKGFLVVLEIKQQYGMDGHGLISCFFAVAVEADTDSPRALRSNIANAAAAAGD